MVDKNLVGCLFESVLTIWCCSLLEDARAILSVQNLHLAVHKFCNLVLCLSVHVFENSHLCVPPFSLCLMSFSLCS